MALTNYTITSPNGGTWTIQSTNTASVGRYHDLSTLSEGSSTNLSKARPGVLCAAAPAASSVPSALQLAVTGSGLNLSVQPGAAVVERGTLVGCYEVNSTTSGTVTLGTADATNPRIDRVDLQVLDGSLGDNGGVSLTRFVVTQGTASGTPVLPTAPSNSVPQGQVLIPANTITLTSGMLTDTRKSAAVRGGLRPLLPGDALTDPGFVTCEERIHYNATYGMWLRDFWDSVGATWRGTQEILFAQPAQTVFGTLAAGATVTMGSIAISDPGFPYHIRASAGYDWASATALIPLVALLQVDSATYLTNMFGQGETCNAAANLNADVMSIVPTSNTRGIQPAGYTGAHTVYFLAHNTSSAAATIYDRTHGGVGYTFTVELVPA